MPIHQEIPAYNASQSPSDKRICDALAIRLRTPE